MKYLDFVKRVAVNANVSQRVAKEVVDSAMSIIKDALKSNDEVVLNGVGKLVTKVRSARTGINPATKQRVEIPQTKTAVFKASKELKDILNA